jgi:hypothetical protein
MKVITIAGALATGAMLLAGCADSGGLGLTTASVTPVTAAAKADPACATLASQIGTLRSEGVADKVEKAAAKKYKMTTADLATADQLNKANADFQAKCAPAPQQTAAAEPAAAAAGNAAAQATAKATDAAAAKATAAAAKQ